MQFEIATNHICIFGAMARWSEDRGWEQNFAGWERFGESRVFRTMPHYSVDEHLGDCILEAERKGFVDAVEKILVSPPVAVAMYVENILTLSDFDRISNIRTCSFDLPAIRFGDIRILMQVRVAQNPGTGFGCAVIGADGRLV